MHAIKSAVQCPFHLQHHRTDMSSLKNSKGLPPPPYDQLNSVDIDNGTAPLLGESFSGSIFGTSTIVKFDLTNGSNPKYYSDTDRISCDSYFDKLADYSFVIRDFLECVQANGKVANTRDDLHTILLDVRENEILQFQKRVFDCIEPPATPPKEIERFLAIITKKNRGNINHIFDVTKNGQLIGSVTFADKEPPETCLRVYIGSGHSELLVKSASMGEFVIFRDQSSSGPLCNIKTEPYEFTGKIVFHPETGITTDEQLLCTAAAFAFTTCRTKQFILDSNDTAVHMCFWMVFTFVVTMIVSGLLLWLGPLLM